MKLYTIVFSLLLLAESLLASQAPCGNPMGCELVYVAQQKYMQLDPDFICTKVSEINDPRIQSEVESLVNKIPNLCYDQEGQLLEARTNSKGEAFIQFSQNPTYKLAIQVIKPHNSPQGIKDARAILRSGKSLRYVEHFDVLNSCMEDGQLCCKKCSSKK